MNPWQCALLITIAGAIGGVVNALLTDNGFILPQRQSRILYPGFISNVLVGALAAFSSWAFYGSGASVELANLTERATISLNGKNYTTLPAPGSAPKKRVRNVPSPNAGVLRSQSLAQ